MADNQTIDSIIELLPLREDDHIRGGDNPEITMVFFGDYECPACGEAYKVVKRIESEMGERLRYVFRHFPYAGIHPHAELAAQAAESAGDQHHFWEMHEALFEDQNALEQNDLVARAQRLALDVERFQDDLKTEKFLDRVRGDFRTGVQNGVFSTPGIFLNGIRHNDAADYETLTAAIEQHLEELKQEAR
jgi:protein-disulfide isomerase